MSSRRRTPRPRRRSTSARILSSEPASRLKLKAITWSGAVIVALLVLARNVADGTTKPRSAQAPVQYGPQIAAVVVYLHAGQFLSKERTALAVAELSGVPLSSGTIAALTARAMPSAA